ncbi:hypothetical protein QUF76_09230 [Desulfobacterales bacterium HSG16]|nr:hypothetical protein [Desulfobacterales bacterium HSG16]
MPSDIETLERRCPRLGSSVTFGYCEQCGENALPCTKVFDCWWEYFNVTEYLKGRLSEEAFATLAQSPPKPKVNSILELIQQAKNR